MITYKDLTAKEQNLFNRLDSENNLSIKEFKRVLNALRNKYKGVLS